MRKYEKQHHELFCNSPHLTYLFIMKRGVGLTTKKGVTGFLYFRDSQLDLHFDSVVIGLMDEHGNSGEAEEHLLENLLPRVRIACLRVNTTQQTIKNLLCGFFLAVSE